jgi:hypothetical protein
VVQYCTADGLVPGVLRLGDHAVEFTPTIPNPFEGSRFNADSRADMSFTVEYCDIQVKGLNPTPVPNCVKRFEDEGCGIDYYVQIHLLDTGER